MRRAYILAYSDSLGNRDTIKNCLSKIPEVVTWRFDMPYSFYIISDHSAVEIARSIRSNLKNGRFLITEITDNKQGWLPNETWYFVNNKKRKPK
jgi:hypothetical protein